MNRQRARGHCVYLSAHPPLSSLIYSYDYREGGLSVFLHESQKLGCCDHRIQPVTSGRDPDWDQAVKFPWRINCCLKLCLGTCGFLDCATPPSRPFRPAAIRGECRVRHGELEVTDRSRHRIYWTVAIPRCPGRMVGIGARACVRLGVSASHSTPILTSSVQTNSGFGGVLLLVTR